MRTVLNIPLELRTCSCIMIFIISFICLTTLSSATYAPAEEWNRTFVYEDYDESGISVQQVSDGGYIIASISSNLSNNDNNILLIKTDSEGNYQWNQTFGGEYAARVRAIQQTFDGDYLISGYSFRSDFLDAWMIRTDSQGNQQWNKTFEGDSDNGLYLVQQTSDGGYIVAGQVTNGSAVCLIKTDSEANRQWIQTFGDYYRQEAASAQETSDGGYIVVGAVYTSEYDNPNVWLVKTDSYGNYQWDQIFGWDYCSDIGYSVQRTSDGGYIVAAKSNFMYPYWDPVEVPWGSDALLIKFDPNGTSQWYRIFGQNSFSEEASFAQETSDGGYILLGSDWMSNLWLIKLENNYSVPGNIGREESVGFAGFTYEYIYDENSTGRFIEEDEDYYDDDFDYEEETVPGFQLFTAISVIALLLIVKRRW
ncbi:hypothetical protein V7O61_04615 [Methanolobus sp. WCC1]|uniref:hypothetical protein n=1 Tax=unclassified Methanolobus TaxID=2629569 RepID=UPI003253DFFA